MRPRPPRPTRRRAEISPTLLPPPRDVHRPVKTAGPLSRPVRSIHPFVRLVRAMALRTVCRAQPSPERNPSAKHNTHRTLTSPHRNVTPTDHHPALRPPPLPPTRDTADDRCAYRGGRRIPRPPHRAPPTPLPTGPAAAEPVSRGGTRPPGPPPPARAPPPRHHKHHQTLGISSAPARAAAHPETPVASLLLLPAHNSPSAPLPPHIVPSPLPIALLKRSPSRPQTPSCYSPAP